MSNILTPVLATLLLGILFVAIYVLGKKYKACSFMVVARFDADCDVEKALSQMPAYQLKNKTMNGEMTELVAEMRLDEAHMEELSQLRNMTGVREITVMRSVTGSVL